MTRLIAKLREGDIFLPAQPSYLFISDLTKE